MGVRSEEGCDRRGDEPSLEEDRIAQSERPFLLGTVGVESLHRGASHRKTLRPIFSHEEL